MPSLLRPTVVVLASLTALTGVVYPLAVTAVARVAFPEEARGSLVQASGHVVGSRLVGAPFDEPGQLWPRPSATTPPYDGRAGAGSNLGPTNPALREAVVARIHALRAADPGNDAPVPVDLVTASGSGLDPHVSPAAAAYQVRRIARVRGLPEDRVRAVIAAHTAGRTFGLLGEPRVDVAAVNRALDALHSVAQR